jgi:hypothetical protein
MTLAYGARLVFECLAALVLVQVVLAFAVSWSSARIITRASALPVRRAATLILAMRLAPLGGALVAMIALCLPSYLWLEPATDGEQVAWRGFALAALGAGLVVWAATRGIAVALKSSRWLREHSRGARAVTIAGTPAVVVESAHPVLALAGVLRPRLVISRCVLEALPPEQLEVAVRHERAHWNSRDNLKRLAIALAPVPLWGRAFRELEHAWARLIEWSADDCAASDDAGARVTLASALVCVSRLGSPSRIAPLATGLMNAGEDLSTRVDRLLGAPEPKIAGRGNWRVICGAAVGLAAMPWVLRIVHAALEELIH